MTVQDEITPKAAIISRLEELIQPLVESQGAELVELQYGRPKRGRGILRLFVDRTGGISIEELARISRMVGGLLEVHDVIPGSYTLEVSSPGLTRALKKPEDYQRYAGRLARVTTRAPWEGRQVHCGIIEGLKDDQVCLKEGESVVLIPLSEIAKARLDLDLKKIGKEG
ncbi:MAG: ribosome maturation factor RimP [Desulfobaccales bacterium]